FRVGYVEAAARGVSDQDAAEMRGLAAAYATCANETIAVGSAKSSCGHAGIAGGVAGIIRAALAIDRSSLPGTPGWTGPRPQAGWHRNAFYVPTERRPWLATEGERIAAVQIGDPDGAAGHVVLSSTPSAGGGRGPDCISLPFIIPVMGVDGGDI